MTARTKSLRILLLSAWLCTALSALGATPPLRSTRYDGTSSAGVQFAHRSEYDATVAMTIEAWIYREDASRCETMVSHDYTASYWFGFCGNRLRFYRSGAISADAPVNVPAHRWAHVAVSYNGTRARFYVDGELVGDVPLANAGAGINRPLRLGSDTGGYYFLGNLDEVRIWSRALAESEIRANLYKELRSALGLAAVFPTAYTTEALRGIGGTAGAGSVQQVFGILPRELSVPTAASAVTMDGSVNLATEYAGAEQMVIRYREGGNVWDAVGYLVYRDTLTDQNLYIGVKGVRETTGGWLRQDSWVAVHADPNYSRDRYAQPNDYQIQAGLDGSTKRWWWGDGGGGYNLATTPPASSLWQIAFSYCNTAAPPCLEFRIHRSMLNTCGRPTGIMLGHFWVGGPGDDYPAPGDAVWNSPATWTPLYYGSCGQVTPPCVSLYCPTNVVANCDGPDGGRAYFSVTATNRCSGTPPAINCVPPTGSTFVVGTTTVICTATGSGETNTCSFPVTILDNCPSNGCLWVQCPTNITVNCTNPAGTRVPYSLAASNLCFPANAVFTSCIPPSGSSFPPGTFPVQCTFVTSAGGNSFETNNCLFTVTVLDNCPSNPCLFVQCPTNITVNCTNPAGTRVAYQLIASNLCFPTNVVFTSCVPPSGSPFPPGTAPVECTFMTSTGANKFETNRCSFTVTVRDNCQTGGCLAVQCPTNITAECLGPQGTPVDYGLSASNRCSTANPVYTSCTPPIGYPFRTGTTPVECVFVTSAGNGAYETNRCNFTVTIRDTTRPGLVCPPNLTQLSPNGGTAIVTFPLPIGTDSCDSNVTVTCQPPSGSPFQVGLTPVNCTAVDDSGNTASCWFTVRVIDPGPLTIDPVPGLGLVELKWSALNGVLEESDSATGPWKGILGAASPHRAKADAARKFYRLRAANGGEILLASDLIGIVPKPGIGANQLAQIASQHQLVLVGQLPGDGAYLFALPQAVDRGTLENLLRTVLSQHPEAVDKAGMVATPEGAQTPMILTDEFIVQFHQNAAKAQMDALNAAYGAQVIRVNPFWKNQLLLRVPANSGLNALELSRRYGQSALVEYAEPNYIVAVDYRATIPNDPLFGNQWHLNNTGQSGGTPDADIDAPQAWDITMGDPGIVIAVIDNGFDADHPDLVPNLWVNTGEIPGNGRDDDGNDLVDDVNGWDFRADDNTLANDSAGPNRAHGTAAAGCAAARGNNLLGVTGSCPNGRLMLLRNAGDSMDHGLAFDYARVQGASIITCSWGYSVGTPVPANVEAAINRAATLGRGGLGSVVLFAMNNINVHDCGAVPDVSSLPNVIAVSRATNRDRFDDSGYGNCMDVLGPTRSDYGFGTLGITTTDMLGGLGYTTGDFAMNFGGTSAATPITAGIAGLVLAVNPTLTRAQVQQLLQDTADKVEHSRGSYSAATGFSSPASGTATHGYGRVNAFEAVRVAAPAPAGRGGVDIFLRDNALDWGNTEQPSNVLMEPTRGWIDHYVSVDIKVDAPPYAATAPNTAAAFEAFAEENPIEGLVNRVYVRVRNRGPVTADTVNVKLHWVFAGAAMPALPADFWSRFPADSTDTSRWHPLGVRTLRNLAYSGPSQLRTGADTAQIAQFDFTAPAFDPTVPAPDHYCLFAVIDSPQDPVSAASRASRIADEITPRDNNVTHKNVSLQPGGGSRELRFYVRNPYDYAIETRITLRGPTNFPFQLGPVPLNLPFVLSPGQELLCNAFVGHLDSNWVGQVSIVQEVLNGNTNSILGGLVLDFEREPRGGQPDLIVPEFQATGAALVLPDGRLEVPVRAVVRNRGTAPAGLFKTSGEYAVAPDTFQFTAAFTMPGQADLWYPWTSAPLAPGAEVTLTGKLTFHSSLSGKTVMARAHADSCSGDEFMPDWCRVLESDETNNDSVSVPILLP